jgi:hypothetical protein
MRINGKDRTMIALLLVIFLYGVLALAGAVIGFMSAGGDPATAAGVSAAATALLIVFSGFFTSNKD